MALELWLNIAVIVLLVATIVCALLLNRRLQAFRAMQATMQDLARDFTSATDTAQQTVLTLKETALSAADTVNHAADTAKKLKEDLDFLVDRGDAMAKRLEEGIDHARDVMKKVQAIATLKNDKPAKTAKVEDTPKDSPPAKATGRKAKAAEGSDDPDALLESLKALR